VARAIRSELRVKGGENRREKKGEREGELVCGLRSFVSHRSSRARKGERRERGEGEKKGAYVLLRFRLWCDQRCSQKKRKGKKKEKRRKKKGEGSDHCQLLNY